MSQDILNSIVWNKFMEKVKKLKKVKKHHKLSKNYKTKKKIDFFPKK